MSSASQQNTQYDQPATQLMDDMPLDDEEDTTGVDASWGQLVSRSANGPHFKLQDFPPDEIGRYHVHLIGRSSQCALQLTGSPRISNKHCVIYCKQNIADPNNPRLEAWIEDLSANGTFINGETRLTKNVPRLLHHRDEIFLVNPEFKRMAKAGTKIMEDIAQNSFVVMLNLPSPVDEFIQESRDYDLQLSQNEASQGAARMDRASTVNRLLGQKRCIYDHYEIKTLLGEGTSGAVYHAINKETGRDWAVKMVPTKNLSLLSSLINSKGGNGKLNDNELTKEAELLRSLRHPHIIHLEDIFADNRRLYLVMEMSSGGDLFDRVVKKKSYPESEAKVVVSQILQAIAYLHEKNIAHRDIKPENILLVSKTSDVDIKLTDFGLAKKLDESGKMKTFCGTPQYFAPEVLQRRYTTKGAGTYSLAADMWSIGVIMFVLLEGNYPFNESTLSQQITRAQYSFSAPAWRSVSEDAKDLIRQLLIVDPAARLTAKQALAHVWFCSAPQQAAGGVSSGSSSASNGAHQHGCAAVSPTAASADHNGHGNGSAVAGIAFDDTRNVSVEPMAVDSKDSAAGDSATAVDAAVLRSETVSTNVTEPTVVAGALAASSDSLDEAAENGTGAIAVDATQAPAQAAGVKTSRSVRSRKAPAQAAAAAAEDFQGTANMSITTAVQFELEKVTLNGGEGPSGASPRKSARRGVNTEKPTPTTGKRKQQVSEDRAGATDADHHTPVKNGDKRSRTSKSTAGEGSAQKNGRTLDAYFPKQSPQAAPSPAGAGLSTRRVTRSASTFGAH